MLRRHVINSKVLVGSLGAVALALAPLVAQNPGPTTDMVDYFNVNPKSPQEILPVDPGGGLGIPPVVAPK
jgi:hypothetical protein